MKSVNSRTVTENDNKFVMIHDNFVVHLSRIVNAASVKWERKNSGSAHAMSRYLQAL